MSGKFFSDEAKEILSAPRHELVNGLLKVFQTYRPSPVKNIFKHPEWRASVFSDIDDRNKFFVEAQHIYEREALNMTMVEYLQMLAAIPDPNRLVFRSDGVSLRYYPIAESCLFLLKWARFQFGDQDKQFFNDIFAWLTRKNFKKGGFSIVGPPSAGKSYYIGALIALMTKYGSVRPNNGYTFNFDDCVDAQVIHCEEFYVDKSDSHSIETIKDSTSGNAASVKVKHRPPTTLMPVPWMFVSNQKNFDFTVTVENPWHSRFYAYEVKEYPLWEEDQRTMQCHPMGWIYLFKKMSLL